MNLLDLTGRVAIVTGAAKGIGRGCAEVLATAGAHVVVTDVDGENGEAVATAINNGEGGSALFVHTDVRSGTAVEAMVATAVERWGRLDVLVNNAGWHNSKGLLDCTEEDWDSIIELNLKSVFLCSKAAFPALKETRGAIISIGSMVGLIGQKDSVAYTASKGAIISMTRSLALDVAPYGIRANCICPGVVDTPLLQEYLAMQSNPEQRRQEFAALHPLERIGTPTDIARAVLFLASDAAAFITGTILPVEGGVTLDY